MVPRGAEIPIILVTGFDALLRSGLRRVMSRRGFLIRTVRYHAETLARAYAGERVAAHIVDASRGNGGIEFAAMLAAVTPQVPVVLCSPPDVDHATWRDIPSVVARLGTPMRADDLTQILRRHVVLQ